FESGRDSELGRLDVALLFGGELLAPPASRLRAEVVERGAARDHAQPGARRGTTRVEATPRAQRALERLAGEILGERRVAREDEQVAVDVVEVSLGDRGEARRPLARRTSRGQSRRRGVHIFHTAQPTVW